MKLAVLYIFYFLNAIESSKILMKSLSIRHVRKNDFGLIFDADVVNDGAAPKETLSFAIDSDKCCLFTNNSWDCDTQKVFGAKVYNVEPGKELVVTLVWPTLVLHDRVGNCSLQVVTMRPTGETVDDSKTIAFNTTLNPSALPDFLIHYFNDMKKLNGYRKCQFEDLDPFADCKPVNCELKYFGKRNFFANSSCIHAKKCESDDESMYDYETNDCIGSNNILSKDDRESMEQGKFTNWIDATEEREASEISAEKSKVLQRLRRDLNSGQTVNGRRLPFFISLALKVLALVILAYFALCVFVFILSHIAVCCGMIATGAIVLRKDCK